MKTLAAVMKAEFRRAMPFLPWIAVTHAMTYGAHTRWAMEFSAQMIALIEWLSGSIAALVAVRSLWWDAPLRRTRFLATKPMPILPLIAGKGLGLSLMLVAPFGIVEGLVHLNLGIRGESLMLGILQMTLLHLVALAALFPVVWWWRGLASAICGVALAAAVVIVSATLVARQPGNLNPNSGTPNSLPFSLLFIFVSLCLLLGLCSLALPLLRKWHRTRFAMFAVLSAFSFYAGLRIATRPPEPDETVYPELVNLIPEQSIVGLKRFETLTASVAGGLAGRDFATSWSYPKLKLDDHSLTLMTPIPGDNWSVNGMGFLLRETLAKRFGGGFLLNQLEPDDIRPAMSVVDDGTCSGPGKSIDLELLETRYRWDVTVDLPLKEGAESSFDGSRCRIDKVTNGNGFGRSKLKGDIVGGVQVSFVMSDVWIDMLWNRKKTYDPPSSGVAMLVDPSTGKAEGLQMIRMSGFTGAVQRVYYSLMRPSYGDIRLENEGLNWSHDLRLVVMQPRMVGRVAHAWKSPGKVRFAPIESRQSPPAIPVAPSGVDIVKWVGLHPVPSREAGAEEVKKWFDEFLPLMKSLDKPNTDHNIPTEADNAMAEFVKNHPDVAVLAVRAWWDFPWFVHDSISRNLPRDVIKRFPELATNGFIQSCFRNQGWTADLADAARDKARSGQAWAVDSILMSVPEKVGLSEEEWMEYFRMRRTVDVYNALADKVVPRARMDAEVDLILESHQTHAGIKPSSAIFELATARGSESVPRWLKEDFQRDIERKSPDFLSLARRLDACFNMPDMDLPENSVEAMKVKTTWFLGVDPSRFVFNPAIRKYQLRPTP